MGWTSSVSRNDNVIRAIQGLCHGRWFIRAIQGLRRSWWRRIQAAANKTVVASPEATSGNVIIRRDAAISAVISGIDSNNNYNKSMHLRSFSAEKMFLYKYIIRMLSRLLLCHVHWPSCISVSAGPTEVVKRYFYSSTREKPTCQN